MICLDASVAVKWVFAESYSTAALKLALFAQVNNEPLVAPTLMPYEVTNVIRQRMTREGLSAEEAHKALATFHQFASSMTYLTPSLLHSQALRLAERFNLGATYDAHYLALAEMFGCELWTADKRLFETVKGKLPFTHWIAEFESEAA